MAHGIDTPQAIQKVNEENKKKKTSCFNNCRANENFDDMAACVECIC